MPENCNHNECPVNARVDRMEKELDRYRGSSSKTHQEMFQRINALEQSNTATQTKLDTIDGKLDKLITWREEQDEKPNKLMDNLKEHAIDYIMIALLGFMLLKMGISA